MALGEAENGKAMKNFQVIVVKNQELCTSEREFIAIGPGSHSFLFLFTAGEHSRLFTEPDTCMEVSISGTSDEIDRTLLSCPLLGNVAHRRVNCDGSRGRNTKILECLQ